MKNNSESALTIKYIIIIFLVLIALGANIQLFTNNNVKIASEEIKTIKLKKDLEKNIQEEIIIANMPITSNVERTLNITAREAEERELQKTKYISIEEITISKDMDLTKRCGISKEDFVELMENMKVDYSGFFAENAETIYDLCEEYELNEIFFCGLIAAESGWKIASNHRNTCNYISMMSGGKLIRYSTPKEGLEAAAKLLHNRYLTEGGSYYSGKTLSNVQRRFCPNSSTWVGLVYGCMKQVIK